MSNGTEVGSLYYDLNIDDKKLNGQLDRADGKLSKLGHTMAGVGRAVVAGLAVAGAATAAFGVSSVKSFMDSQNAVAQLNAVVKSTGGIAGVTSEAAQELASSLQKVTRFSDEAILSAESQLLTFTSIGKKVFPDATKSALDMATAMGMDAFSAAQMLGKALNNPTVGLGRLTKVGVQFTEAQKKQIIAMQAAGDIAGAQAEILKELQVEFGGSAEAAGKTFAGSLDRLKNSFDDLKEGIGKTIVDAITPLLTSLATFVSSDKFKKWVEDLSAYLKEQLPKAINYITSTVLPTLKKILDEVWPVIQTVFVKVAELINFLSNNTWVLWGIVTAFVAIKTAMFLSGALVAFQNVMAGARIAYAGLVATIASPIVMPAIIIAAALAAIGAVYNAYVKTRDAIRDTQNAIDNGSKSSEEAMSRVIANYKAGKITKEQYQHFFKSISGRALGGSVTAGTPYIVGERGPELMVPSSNGSIVPNNKLSGGITVNIGTISNQQDADYLLNRLDRNAQLQRMGMSPA